MSIIPIREYFIPSSAAIDLKRFKQKRNNVLVVSPHPDDDVIGAGGTMAMLARRGCSVFSLYVTDGRSSVFNNFGVPADTVFDVRQNESINALRTVGAMGGIFLKHESCQLENKNKRVVDEISEVIRYFMPAELYLPSTFERHLTHRLVTGLTIKALRRINGYCPKLWGYNVWSGLLGLPGTKTLDISDAIKIKQKAVRRHKSQIQYKAYDEGITGRNRYEAVFLETHGKEAFKFAETFLNMQELVSDKQLSLKAFSKKILKSANYMI